MKESRFREIYVLLYRLGLVFLFYQIARLLFWFFNRNLIKIETVREYFNIAYYGTAFDTTAILYINALFILLSIIPLTINTKKGYQKMLFWVYFITNGLAYTMNFGDFVYFKFSQSRLTSAVLNVIENEDNLVKVFMASIVQNPFIILSFLGLMALWVFLYKRIKIEENRPSRLVPYFVFSVLHLCLAAVLTVGGIRGDFKHSTRPINMVDANRHIQNPVHANLVLNSVFSFFRTINTNGFKEVHFVDEKFIE